MAQFGFNSTAAEVLAGHDLSGRTALVTGGTSGIGMETARALAAAGARVVITARNKPKAEEALDHLHKAAPDADLDYALVDLGSLDSVREASEDIRERFPVIHILINNAGVMATPFGRTVDGFETQFGTNHLGHFVLTNLLVPALIAGAPSRIILLSSSAHQRGDVQWEDIHFETQPYDPVRAYAQSKTANVLFAVELDRLISDNYFCRSTTTTFAGRRRPDDACEPSAARASDGCRSSRSPDGHRRAGQVVEAKDEREEDASVGRSGGRHERARSTEVVQGPAAVGDEQAA